jgi:hypothetical protein
MNLSYTAVSTLTYLPEAHKKAFARYAKTLSQPEFSPLTSFYYSMHTISTTISAVLGALNRPTNLIQQMQQAQKAMDRHAQSLRRSDRWPTSLSLLDETRHRMQRDAQEKMEKSRQEFEGLGKELRYTQAVVAGELAAWQEERVKWGRQALKDVARRMVTAERARLEGMRRALRVAGINERESSAGAGTATATSAEIPEIPARGSSLQGLAQEPEPESES